MKSTTCRSSGGQFLEEYHSRSAAEMAAESLDRPFKPVQCPRCGYWHLAPVQTRRQCFLCTDSGLFLKDIYSSREEAQRTAELLRREKRVQVYPYKCPHGSGWHLTKGRR